MVEMEHRRAHKLEEKERTDDVKIPEDVSFSELYLSESVLSGLESAGFVHPSPIQLKAIPIGRCGIDILVQSKSGTGKTVVFAVIALEMISLMAKTIQVLIIAPTREIAVQINQVIDLVGQNIEGLKTALFIGGSSVVNDKSKLPCHIAIGTPGRIKQLIEIGLLKVDNIRLLVLDEADQLLKEKFKVDILKITNFLPHNKQVLALSATFPDDIASIVEKLMRSPSYIRLSRDSPSLLGIKQFVKKIAYHPQQFQRHKLKRAELLKILSSYSFNQCLIFSNSQMRAESLCNYLRGLNWPVAVLSGSQTQTDRLAAFEALCTHKIRILVSTDLSARGLDSEHVNLVINLDIPWDQATYLHRVGRAGRYGTHGTSISFACEGDEWIAMRAIATIPKLNIKVISKDSRSDVDFKELEYLEKEELNVWLQQQSNINKKWINKKMTSIKDTKKNDDIKLKKSSKFLEECLEKKLKLTSELEKEEESRVKCKELALKTLELRQNINTLDVSFNKIQDFFEEHLKDENINVSHSVCLQPILTDIPSDAEFNHLEEFLNSLSKTSNKMSKKIATSDINTLLNKIITTSKREKNVGDPSNKHGQWNGKVFDEVEQNKEFNGIHLDYNEELKDSATNGECDQHKERPGYSDSEYLQHSKGNNAEDSRDCNQLGSKNMYYYDNYHQGQSLNDYEYDQNYDEYQYDVNNYGQCEYSEANESLHFANSDAFKLSDSYLTSIPQNNSSSHRKENTSELYNEHNPYFNHKLPDDTSEDSSSTEDYSSDDEDFSSDDEDSSSDYDDFSSDDDSSSEEDCFSVDEDSFSDEENSFTDNEETDSVGNYGSMDHFYKGYIHSTYSYIHSAKKFASMMEYVQTLGRASFQNLHFSYMERSRRPHCLRQNKQISPYFPTVRNKKCQSSPLSQPSIVLLQLVPIQKLDEDFFNKDCFTLAKALLGQLLIHEVGGQRISGFIVETECYLGVNDGASHSYKGKRTNRTEPMFMKAGTSYVYSIYGMYHCFNISSQDEGSCVLLRALEPFENIPSMHIHRQIRRKSDKALKDHQLTNGPSKLCQSLAIEKSNCNKLDMCNSSTFWLERGTSIPESNIVTSKRIGIESTGPEWANKPWRFYILANPNVSVRDKLAEQKLKTLGVDYNFSR